MVKIKATWNAIAITGNREAYVAIVDGKEYGTIARYNRNSAWTIYKGIGMNAKLIGTSFNKEEAKWILLGK